MTAARYKRSNPRLIAPVMPEPASGPTSEALLELEGVLTLMAKHRVSKLTFTGTVMSATIELALPAPTPALPAFAAERSAERNAERAPERGPERSAEPEPLGPQSDLDILYNMTRQPGRNGQE